MPVHKGDHYGFMWDSTSGLIKFDDDEYNTENYCIYISMLSVINKTTRQTSRSGDRIYSVQVGYRTPIEAITLLPGIYCYRNSNNNAQVASLF